MTRRAALWGLALLLGLTTTVAAARSGLGINLGAVAYWQTDWPFINEMKRAGGWYTTCDPWQHPQCKDFASGAAPQNTKEQDQLELDEHGWPKRLPADDDARVKFRHVTALLFQGDGGSHPAGRYVVLYDGKGTLLYPGAARKVDAESKPGRDVVEVTSQAALMVRIARTDPADHLRNIRVIGPGGICADAPLAWVPDASACRAGTPFRSLEALAATQTFHPAFLRDLQGFRALRFTKWGAANTSKAVHWDQRPQPPDAFWSGADGVPLEPMFELARATGADPWISVPPLVDDEYVRRFAALAKRSLARGATLWFEYGNEPWNQAPPYSQAGVMFEQQARAKWPGATLAPWQQRLNWYAYRSVQMCGIVKQEFGADAARVRCVVNSQGANAPAADTILGCPLAQQELGGPCAKRLDALAIAPYFGYALGDNARAATVDRWADAPDGGLDTVFDEITRDLPRTQTWMTSNKAVADRYGLPLVAYEGGQHLTTYRGGKSEAMFRAANRDARMGTALRTLLDEWKDSGGQLFVAFEYTGQAARGGFWGMKEHQRDDAAPKWQATRALRDAPCWWKGCDR